MKKLIAILMIGLLAACSDPKDILLTKAEDVEKNAEQIKKLSDDEKKLLVAYVFRAEAGQIFGANASDNYGITVGEAIKRQKQFAEEQKVKEEAKKAEEEKARKELEAKRTVLNSAVDVIFVHHEFQQGKYKYDDKVRIALKIINKSDKAITGIKGILTFTDKFDDVLKKVEFKSDFIELDGKLAPGKEFDFSGTVDVNHFIQEDIKFAETPTKDMKFTYEPEVVIFEDGSKLEVGK
ncbi:hypothetical protein [Bergeriella denitrificans]|uniref:Lipoprotein n=1 Tax=Bergeriella denitrificans TaxID=494 RepID=A0A378UL30_BERDE|nr:hypothetical protein [Bergeriella denitrificans]STZ77359.1 Uncharacterised protein [Bergeriella denitrificans]